MAFVKAMPQISNLFVLMFLIMFIFALLGMQVTPMHTVISAYCSPMRTHAHPCTPMHTHDHP